MTAYDVERGDQIHAGHPVTVDRYTKSARVNHWFPVTCSVLLGWSGLSCSTRGLFFLTGWLAGGQWTATIHPWFAVRCFSSFSGLSFVSCRPTCGGGKTGRGSPSFVT